MADRNISERLSERSLLLPDFEIDESIAFPLLVELIGARNLPGSRTDTFCVVHFGSKTIHRTKVFVPKVSKTARLSGALRHIYTGEESFQHQQRNPIYTVKGHSLFVVPVKPSDIDNNKTIVITVWAKTKRIQRLKDRTIGDVSNPQYEFVGKLRLASPVLLQHRPEERMEFPLVDDLGNEIKDDHGQPSLLALRFRFASKPDVAFVNSWNNQDQGISIVKDGDIFEDADELLASLITEVPEKLSMPTYFAAALDSMLFTEARPKPYPDPARPKFTQSMSPLAIKTQTKLPSERWVRAASKGSTSLGRLYLEILSAHNLPNVDFIDRRVVGKTTDAFCTAIYGDSMVQTDVIDDEASPHWLPWTQRAFVFQITHPGQALYLSIFGFRSHPLRHKAIGRVEIASIGSQFQADTVYNLEYKLKGKGKLTEKQSLGTIRIRLRIECDNERKFLFQSLKLPPPVYINVSKRKSLLVARYTCYGDYRDTTFSLPVFQGYIDELLDGYLKRFIYDFQNGGQALMFWRNPMHSLLLFVVGLTAVEHPRLIPGFLCLGISIILLGQLFKVQNSPSPWHRSATLGHYARILVFGNSTPRYKSIHVNEGYEEYKAAEEAARKQMKNEKEYHEKREAAEKQIEQIEKTSVQTRSNGIPTELTDLLGKIQAIIGTICRVLRRLDAIIKWEDGDVTFFATTIFLLSGIIFLFLPWGLLLRWIGRFLVVISVGPQNKLIDMWFSWDEKKKSGQNVVDDQRLRRIFAKRSFEARCKQEEVRKLKEFRGLLFGKYSIVVPFFGWTRQSSNGRDVPLPSSTAEYMPKASVRLPGSKKLQKMPVVTGQQLVGPMIPRPIDSRKRNMAESDQASKSMECTMLARRAFASGKDKKESFNKEFSGDIVFSLSTPFEQGVEVTDIYDEEELLSNDHSPLTFPRKSESIHELGVEVTENDDGRGLRFLSVWTSLRGTETWNSPGSSSDRSTSTDDGLG